MCIVLWLLSGRMTRDATSQLKAYAHQYAWLQYASLALTAAATLYSEHGDLVDIVAATDSATQLYETNIQTTINYFTQRTTANHQQLGLNLLFIVFLWNIMLLFSIFFHLFIFFIFSRYTCRCYGTWTQTCMSYKHRRSDFSITLSFLWSYSSLGQSPKIDFRIVVAILLCDGCPFSRRAAYFVCAAGF